MPIETGLSAYPSEDQWSILEVLKFEDEIVQVCLYKIKFD